jgi:hypothetical protein
MAKKLPSLLAILALGFSLGAAPVQNCRCKPEPVKQALRSALVVVSGPVLEVVESKVFKVGVSNSLKGSIEGELAFTTGTGCGVPFEKGKVVTLYSRSRHQPLSTNLCIGSHVGPPTADELRAIDTDPPKGGAMLCKTTTELPRCRCKSGPEAGCEPVR